MAADSVHVAIPMNGHPEQPGGCNLRSLALLTVACGCCFVLGFNVRSAADVTLVVTPAMQRAVVTSLPAAGSVRAAYASARDPRVLRAADVGVDQIADPTLHPAVPAPASAGFWAAGIFAPALTALIAVYYRFSRPAVMPAHAMGAVYGTTAGARGEATKLSATAEEGVAEVFAEEEVASPDLSAFMEEDEAPRGRGKGKGKGKGKGGKGKGKGKGKGDEFREVVVQVRRVTKVVKGGKQLSFRAVVVAGDGKGKVGVGVASNKEVMGAVQKAAKLARRDAITVPLSRIASLPHPMTATLGAAKVFISPACDGTGVIAGGAVRAVMEMAGIKNVLAKQQGTDNPLSNARCALKALGTMRTFRQIAEERGVELSSLCD